MNPFKVDKVMDRLDKMLENAMNGRSIETDFDESKMSALESKFARYLSVCGISRNQLLEEKSKIHQLVSDISHQTKTPIANLLLYTQLLEESDLSQQDRLCVQSLSEQAEKLDFLIQSLVKTSRLETGIISVTPKLQSIGCLFEDIVAQSTSNAHYKQIHLSYEPTHVSALFDFKWTCEALHNILDNAIKYSPIGSSISIKVEAYQLFCRIDIIDTGIGIHEEEIPKIFARFYRSESVAEIQGVGIGLYLAREIITSEGGYIKVSSQLGKGSTFSVFLPMNF